MWFGILAGLAASACWAAANVFVQRSGRALGSVRAVVWTLIGGGVLLAPVAWLFDHPVEVLSGRTVGWAVVAGLAGVLAYGCLFCSGVGRAPIVVVSPLAGLASAFTVLYAWIVLRERPARPVLLGAALACAGVVILAL